MGVKFEHVFTGVAVRRLKEKRETLIEWFTGLIQKRGEGGNSRGRHSAAEQFHANLAHPRTRQAHDADAATPCGGCDRADGRRSGCGGDTLWHRRYAERAFFACASMRRLMFHCCAMVSRVLVTQ